MTNDTTETIHRILLIEPQSTAQLAETTRYTVSCIRTHVRGLMDAGRVEIAEKVGDVRKVRFLYKGVPDLVLQMPVSSYSNRSHIFKLPPERPRQA